MTSQTIDNDKAWDDFVKERSFQKATSIQGQMDTITSMLSEIKTDIERVADQAAVPADPMGGMPAGGAPVELPEDMPPMDDLGAEDMMPPEDEGLEDNTMDSTAPPNSGMPGAGGVDESMAPEVTPEEGPVDMPPEEEPVEAPIEEVGGGTPVESDLIGQIKVMIANTQDNEQLKGLSNLLSTALSQNQPASPMQGADTAEMDQTSVVKSADVNNDGEEVMKEYLAGAVDNTLGVGFSKSEDEEKDKEEDKKDDEPKDDAPKDDTPAEDVEDDDEVVMEIESEPAPDAPTVGQDVAAAVADVVEEIVDAALEEPQAVVEMAEAVAEPVAEPVAEDTEPFETSEGPVMKSFSDMLAEKMRVGIDGQPSIVKGNGTSNDMTRLKVASDIGDEEILDESIPKVNGPEAARQHPPKDVKKSALDASGAPSDAPAEDDKAPQDVPTGGQEQSEDEDIIASINAESIGKSAAPSVAEMFAGKSALMNAYDFMKADVGQPKDADSLRAEGEMPTGKISVPKDADDLREEGECATGDAPIPKDADSLRKSDDEVIVQAESIDPTKPIAGEKKVAKPQPVTEEMKAPGGLFGNAYAQMRGEGNWIRNESTKKSGIYLKSFAEMYGDKSGDFRKSADMATVDRPSFSASGSQIGRPELETVKKSQEPEKKPLRIGFGVDAHEAVASDWAKYRELKNQGMF